MSIIQIDDQLQASHLRLGITLITIFLITVLVYFLSITLIYKIGLILLFILVYLFSRWQRPHLLAMSTLANNNNQQKFGFLTWYLQCVQGYVAVPYGEMTDIYQANLSKIDDLGWVMVLYFDVFEPFVTPLKLYVWHDQVSEDSWQQLKILAR